MKKIVYSVMLALTLSLPLCLTSCNGCTEEAASRLYDVNLDLDDDGDYGDRSGETNVSFKNTNKGPCRDCGLDHYGNYNCPGFKPKSSSGTTCDICGCSMSRHYKNPR